jgi:hypothetical protein
MKSSLQNIQLPAFVLVDLYKESIVVQDNQQAAQEKKQDVDEIPKGKWFLGDNKKQITILVHDTEAVFLNDNTYTFLSSILAACKLNVGDVAIINFAKTRVTLNTILNELKPNHLLVFGPSIVNIELPFSIPQYQIKQLDNCNYLTAVSLETMQGNTSNAKEEKGKLWKTLQQIFQLK